MKKSFLNLLGILLFLSMPSLYAYNNAWSDNEDYVVVSEGNVKPGEGDTNQKIKGAGICPVRKTSPVYAQSGHFTWSAADITLPGKPGLLLRRSYTSKEPLSGMFGNGWISNFESGFVETIRHVDKNGLKETHYIYRKENGIRYTFKEVNGVLEAPSGMYQTIEKLTDTSFQVTYPDHVIETYSDDVLVSKEDSNGNRIDYIYDVNNVLQEVINNNGSTLELMYGENGYVTAVTDHTGRTWRYSYDEEGNLVSVTNPLGDSRHYEYEKYQADNDAQSYSHLTKITDESGVVITEVVYEKDQTGSYAFINGRVKSYTIGEDTYTYDWRYINSYNRVNKTDSLGSTTQLYLSESGHVTKYINTYNQITLYNVDENSTLTGVTDKNGNTWNRSVDEEGRIISKTTPLGAQTSYSYEGDRREPSTITSALGHVTTITYDENKNPTAITLPDNSIYSVSYDSKGNIVNTTSPSGVQTTAITYNANSQPTTIQNALGDTISLTYNTLGMAGTVTDAQGNTTTYTYNVMGHLTKTVNAMGHTMVYTYDGAGRLLSLRDPSGNSTGYQYDEFGRVSKVTRPNGRTLTYSYDTGNRLTSVADSAGRETIFTYDRVGNITKVAAGSSYIQYWYDATGNMTRAYDSNSNQNIYFTYNADGQLTQEKQHNIAVDYAYDSDGNLATMAAMGTTTTYTRNSVGDLISLNDGTDTFTFTYDADGRRKNIAYPNGLQTIYGYDNASRLTYLFNAYHNNYYTYDKNGMLTQKTVDDTVTNYSYDTIGRVTAAGTNSYTYDTAGNIMNNLAVYDSSSYQLRETATHSFEYDAFGNMVKKTEKGSGDYKLYSWNVWDQLTKVESFDMAGSSLKKIEFAYGPLGRRLFKTVDGTLTKYLYSGQNLIAIMDYYSNLKYRILQDEEIDSPLSIVDVSSASRYYYHKDRLGSIIGLSDSVPNSMEYYSYSPHGNTVKSSSVETGNPFAYTGREMDDEDLYYYRARYYDPSIGRFLSEDPIGFASGDFNFYRYVLNNPINYIDPYGYGFWKFVGFVAVGAIAAPAAGATAVTGAVVGGVAYTGYTLWNFMKNAGERMKRNIKRRQEIDASLYGDNPDSDTIIRRRQKGLNETKEALKEGYSLPGTFVGGPVITGKEDVIVAGVNEVLVPAIYSPPEKNSQFNEDDCSNGTYQHQYVK